MLRDASEPELARVQRALFAEISGARGRAGPRARFAAWIAAMTPDLAREQIGVYRRMYALRLAREVTREYPATRALLGAERFDHLAQAFIARRRSLSFTLEGYAADLPAFLMRSRALRGLLRDRVAALARYERARAVALCAPVSRGRSRPGRLLRADGAHVLEFDFDVETAWARFVRRAPLGTLRARRTFVVIFRRNGAVASLRVAPREAPLLRALLRGERIETAVDSATTSSLRPSMIRAALERWVGAGLVAGSRA